MKGTAIIRLVLLLVGLRSTPLLAQLLPAPFFSPLVGAYKTLPTVYVHFIYGVQDLYQYLLKLVLP